MSNEYQVRVITPPTIEPVSITEAKRTLRVDHDVDDALISSLIVAARQEAEGLARRTFVNQTLELSLAAWPGDDMIRLPMPPLVSVTSITYLSDANVSAVMPSADYIVIADVEPGLITLAKDKTWPTGTLRSVLPIRVRYVAGYGASSASVPDRYKALILSLVAIRYEYRDDMTATAERMLTNVRSALAMEWGW